MLNPILYLRSFSGLTKANRAHYTIAERLLTHRQDIDLCPDVSTHKLEGEDRYLVMRNGYNCILLNTVGAAVLSLCDWSNGRIELLH